MEFITLTKTDPEFDDHLLGTFSRHLRALPIETYHAQTPRERVTFRLVPIDKISAPAWWKIYFWSSRPELLVLTLGPSMVAWLSQKTRLETWTLWPSWLALMGIFFLHTSVFLFMDVQDHLKGADRLNRRRGSQVIQKGWVAAHVMRRWAWVNFALAALFGLPATLNAPGGLAGVCTVTLLGLLIIWQNWGARWGLTDLSLGLLFGPLLTMGTALASFGRTNLTDAVLGLAFAATTVWVLQIRQMENLFRSLPESIRGFLGFWPFERVRLFVLAEGGLLLLLQPMVAWWLKVPVLWMTLLPVVSAPTILCLSRVWQAASPLSSSLWQMHRWALRAHLAWTAWWVVVLGVAWL